MFEEISRLKREAEEEGSLGAFYTRNGGFSVLPVTQNVPRDLLRYFSTAEIREMISQSFMGDI